MNYKDQIDEYLLGKLSGQETKVFESQLLSDTELAKEVEKRKMIVLGMEALAHQKMKQQILSARQEMIGEQKDVNIKPKAVVKKMNRWWWTGVAAIITICVIAGYLFLQSKPTCEEIFVTNFKIYKTEFGTRNSTDEKELLQAERLYKEKKYEAAIPLLTNLLKEQPTNSEYQLVLGNSYLSLGKTKEAMKYFGSIIKRNDLLYSDTGRWYQALSYLRLENIVEAKKLLMILVADPKADFHNEAKKLLSEI